jgi:DNA-binding transcriptional LysR family regulator
VDLNLLYVLHILLQEQNVSRAATRLNLTQPTVSGMLARLRDTFNDPLFIRVSHGLEPTTQALGLQSDLAKILQDIELLIQRSPFDPSTSTATIRLSTNDYMQYVFLVPALRKLKQAAPFMKFAIVQPEIGTLHNKLLDGDIDLAITIPEFTDARLREQLLYPDQYVAVLRMGHPLGEGQLTLEKFIEMDHGIVSPTDADFFGPTDKALARLGKSRRVTVSTSSFFSLIQIIATSDQVALLPRRLAEQFTDRLQLIDPPIAVEGFQAILSWHQRTDLDPVRLWVAQELTAFADQFS